MVVSVVDTAAFAGPDRAYDYDAAGNLAQIRDIDLNSDPQHCGRIDNVCPTGGSCVGGQCVPSGTAVPSGTPTEIVQHCMTTHCGVPAQPKLVAGNLHGHRVCGNFAGSSASFFFDCADLPSSVDSGWQLTPPVWINPDATSHLNREVMLTVATPTQTELLIYFENEAGGQIEQVQVARQAGDAEVRDVGAHGQVAETMTDDGFTRLWTLQFLVNTCMDVAKLNIFTIGSSGTTNGVKSTFPLRVWLLRDPADFAAAISCF
jgi:hypothetical protein